MCSLSAGGTMNTNTGQIKKNTKPKARVEQDEPAVKPTAPPSRRTSDGTIGCVSPKKKIIRTTTTTTTTMTTKKNSKQKKPKSMAALFVEAQEEAEDAKVSKSKVPPKNKGKKASPKGLKLNQKLPYPAIDPQGDVSESRRDLLENQDTPASPSKKKRPSSKGLQSFQEGESSTTATSPSRKLRIADEDNIISASSLPPTELKRTRGTLNVGIALPIEDISPSSRTKTSQPAATTSAMRGHAGETDVVPTTTLSRGTELGKPKRLQQPEPGAFLVQGQEIARAVSGCLSPQELSPKTTQQSPSKRRQQSPSLRTSRRLVTESSSNRVAAVEQQPNVILVEATLSSEAEAQLEEKVRQRILREAARAEVVSVENSRDLQDRIDRELYVFKKVHKPKGVMEKLFGDARNSEDVDISASPDCIRKRDYLKWTLRRNTATNEWVATVNTNQKVVEADDRVELQRSFRSFVAPTQQEAHAMGLAMAVPKMLPFDDNPICHICKGKFALLRRPCHCRNCGVCICSACSTTWPSKMIPDTYNTKSLSQVNVCIACDWLSDAFREALEMGKYKAALNLYATGNVNVRTPFCSSKNAEVVYPVHLAVQSGNLKLVKWLAGDRWCPVRVSMSTSTKQKRGSGGKKQAQSYGPLLTSKDRSPLGIALSDQKLDIVHYLVAEKNMSFFEEKDVSSAMALANFNSMLRMVPSDFFDGKKIKPTPIPEELSTSNSSAGSTSLFSIPAAPSSSKSFITDSTHTMSTAASTLSSESSL